MGAAGGRGRGLIALKQTAQLPLAAPRKQHQKSFLLPAGVEQKKLSKTTKNFSVRS
jgi:hypothetical protein